MLLCSAAQTLYGNATTANCSGLVTPVYSLGTTDSRNAAFVLYYNAIVSGWLFTTSSFVAQCNFMIPNDLTSGVVGQVAFGVTGISDLGDALAFFTGWMYKLNGVNTAWGSLPSTAGSGILSVARYPHFMLRGCPSSLAYLCGPYYRVRGR